MCSRRWLLAGFMSLIAALGLLGASAAVAWAGPTPLVSSPTTTMPAAPPTTVQPIGSQIAPTPATVPFTTQTTNGTINPIWAKISLAGFALVVVLLVVQAALTRSSRRGRRTL